jgi:hypothetical protein
MLLLQTTAPIRVLGLCWQLGCLVDVTGDASAAPMEGDCSLLEVEHIVAADHAGTWPNFAHVEGKASYVNQRVLLPVLLQLMVGPAA